MNINQEMLNDFWQTIGFEQGTNRVVINYGQSQTYLDDFFLINKNGKYYIHDKKNNRLFDQQLNYYQNGSYYNRKGELIQNIPNDNIIDINPDDVYKFTSNNNIEYFDSDGNSLGFKKPKKRPQYSYKKGPKLKEKTNKDTPDFSKNKPLHPQITPEQLDIMNQYGSYSDEFYKSRNLNPIEERQKVKDFYESKNIELPDELKKYFETEAPKLNKKRPQYKPKKGPRLKEKNKTNESSKPNEIYEQSTKNINEIKNEPQTTKELPKKNLSNASSEAIEKVTDITDKAVKNINFKKVGVMGAVAAVTGLTAYGIGKHSKKKKEKQENQKQTPNYQTHVASTVQARHDNAMMYNSYAQQMAKDISSYRYGKQMTGFI